jgi:hypothetical protein
MNPCREGGRR